MRALAISSNSLVLSSYAFLINHSLIWDLTLLSSVFDINSESSFEYDLIFLNFSSFLKKLLTNELITSSLFSESKTFDNASFASSSLMPSGEDKSLSRAKFLRNSLLISSIEISLIALLLGILSLEYQFMSRPLGLSLKIRFL
ncbi:hypothetical protein MBOVJF4428_00807 [Mycoplasmopsis agalactiae]|nr:hypothetical protein MBOVJF4428_00807 [Mycoplasmopsis agalactiae]